MRPLSRRGKLLRNQPHRHWGQALWKEHSMAGPGAEPGCSRTRPVLGFTSLFLLLTRAQGLS